MINELGSLALATRLKNLSERLAREVAQIYKQSGFDFEPRWFAMIYALKEGDELTVMELSALLQQTHPAVNQVANTLVRRGLIVERKHKDDQRKRLLKLSRKGNNLVKKLNPLWERIKAANDSLLKESNGFLDKLSELEEALNQEGIRERM